MSPVKTGAQAAPSKDIELIRSAIETSLGGLLTVLFKKETYSQVELFKNGVDLIDVEAKVGLPNAPLVDFHLKIAGPGPHADAPKA